MQEVFEYIDDLHNRLMASGWSETLNMPGIEPDDDYFAGMWSTVVMSHTISCRSCLQNLSPEESPVAWVVIILHKHKLGVYTKLEVPAHDATILGWREIAPFDQDSLVCGQPAVSSEKAAACLSRLFAEFVVPERVSGFQEMG